MLDMGKPVRIEDLAISMVKLSGRRLSRDTGVDADIDIVIEGLRPGEKMFEELFLTNEVRQTDVKKVLTADETWIVWSDLVVKLKQLEQNALPRHRDTLKVMLLELAFLRKGKFDNSKRSNLYENESSENSEFDLYQLTSTSNSLVKE